MQIYLYVFIQGLTHGGRVTHICISILSIIASDNGLLPVRRQAIIWTNAGIFLIGPVQTSLKYLLKFIHFHSRRSVSKYRPENSGHFVPASICWSIAIWHISKEYKTFGACKIAFVTTCNDKATVYKMWTGSVEYWVRSRDKYISINIFNTLSQWTKWQLLQIVICHLFSGQPLPQPMLHYC